MRAACVQMRSGVRITDNMETVDTFVRQAAEQGAKYVQTPEMTGILQKSRRKLFEEIFSEEEDPLIKLAGELAAELGIFLHIGSHAVRLSDEKAANRCFVFDPSGKLIQRYDKIHMFDVDLDNGESWRESKVYMPGEASHTITVDSHKVGLAICYDVRFPHLFREQALAGAQVLTCPAAFTRQTGRAHWHTLLKARAIENGAYMIAAAQGGDHEDGRETYGHSLIINPWGEIIAENNSEDPGVIVADIEPEQSRIARQKIPNLANSRSFVFESAE